MNERLLIIAAKWIVEMASSRPSLDDCRREVERCRNDCLTFDKQSWVEESIADCDAWLAMAKLHEEQKAIAERMRAAIAAAPQEVLSDAERAECVAELDQAMAQTGRVSNGEVLLAILERARKENEELKAKRGMGLDEPIADKAECAATVASLLRERGIRAVVFNQCGIEIARLTNVRCGYGPDWSVFDMRLPEFALFGPRTIADSIQKKEAFEAQEWSDGEL